MRSGFRSRFRPRCDQSRAACRTSSRNSRPMSAAHVHRPVISPRGRNAVSCCSTACSPCNSVNPEVTVAKDGRRSPKRRYGDWSRCAKRHSLRCCGARTRNRHSPSSMTSPSLPAPTRAQCRLTVASSAHDRSAERMLNWSHKAARRSIGVCPSHRRHAGRACRCIAGCGTSARSPSRSRPRIHSGYRSQRTSAQRAPSPPRVSGAA